MDAELPTCPWGKLNNISDFLQALAAGCAARPDLTPIRLSYDFSRREGEKEPLGEGGCPLVSGEGRIGSTLTV